MTLQQQMRNFSVRASQCTCCSLDHVDPTTGEEKGLGLLLRKLRSVTIIGSPISFLQHTHITVSQFKFQI